ncbi:CobW family GTP-binding protein [Marinobacter sp. X15-166B]|uniref:CobW family GTP-binding protein n=1 Tax=Marinobacter sp. X15-166B TaxID=1897620 RepID=UPI00085C8CFD|nr:GTP-binding protein [Marinobacter sp. X15-166B]OEY65349.1 cobalamin biosynthesis protein CobW [Marinobacter sp. X15-166B]
MKSPIPTTLVLGFLGVGKTTAIAELLKQKPSHEVWAVLVNEFGEVGIDGALLQEQGAFVHEVPGGCMCCVAGLPMQVGLNRLIRQARPDRLLIEPTGLGHPAQVLATLTGEHYRNVLELGPVLCLVDPRRLEEPRVLASVQFQDQVATADILVANKTDVCDAAQLAHFDAWAARVSPAKRAVFHTREGRLDLAWLEGASALNRVATPESHLHPQPATAAPVTQASWQVLTNEGQGYFSVGWRLPASIVLDERGLLTLVGEAGFARFKAVVRTSAGWRTINSSDGAVTVRATTATALSRLEAISAHPMDADALTRRLQNLVRDRD